MTTPADLVRDSCAALAGYRAALERHVTQAASPQGGMAPRPADAPFPGDPQAFARNPVCAGPYVLEHPYDAGDPQIRLRRSEADKTVPVLGLRAAATAAR